MSRRKRREFKAEFKREAVGLTKVGDRTIGQVARDRDLTETALREWVKREEKQAASPVLGALTTGREGRVAEAAQAGQAARDGARNTKKVTAGVINTFSPCMGSGHSTTTAGSATLSW